MLFVCGNSYVYILIVYYLYSYINYQLSQSPRASGSGFTIQPQIGIIISWPRNAESSITGKPRTAGASTIKSNISPPLHVRAPLTCPTPPRYSPLPHPGHSHIRPNRTSSRPLSTYQTRTAPHRHHPASRYPSPSIDNNDFPPTLYPAGLKPYSNATYSSSLITGSIPPSAHTHASSSHPSSVHSGTSTRHPSISSSASIPTPFYPSQTKPKFSPALTAALLSPPPRSGLPYLQVLPSINSLPRGN